MLAILIAILKIVAGFTVVIGIHEFGHALAAALCGVKVNRFSIGVGPGLKFKNVPLVNELVISPIVIGGYVMLDENSLAEKSFWKRNFVNIAGMLANVLLAIILLIVLGYPVLSSIFLSFKIWLLGIPLSIYILSTGQVSFSDGVAGPVGIGQLMAGHHYPYLLTIAFINLAIATTNLLPLPPLDGGQILKTILEKVIGKNLTNKIYPFITVVGLVLLIGLAIFATANDLVRIFHPS